jgi:hypothetical protein
LTEELNIENFTFVREDWTQYRSLERLSQRAGVTTEYILPLVVKELIDNAWDASASDVTLDKRDDGTVIVSDDGPGIDPNQIGRMFSVNRPLESSKLWRLPTRGALGNGLRVVTGAVMASQGKLTVITRGNKCRVIPNQETGESLVSIKPVEKEIGTSVEINIPNLDSKKDPFMWEGLHGVPKYKGKTNFHWYSVDNLHELFSAAKDLSVRQLVAQFDGATGPNAGIIAGDFLNREASSLTVDEIERLLSKGQAETKNINPTRLGYIGEREGFTSYYKKPCFLGTIPMVIEIWGRPSSHDSAKFYFNHSSMPGDIWVNREKKKLMIVCNEVGMPVILTSTTPLSLEVNITTPFIHSTNESKMPDLFRYITCLSDGIIKVQKQIERRTPKPVAAAKKPDIKEVVFNRLDDAIAHASGNGKFRYSLRQLFYAVRPYVEEETGAELTYEYFTQLITEKEDGCDLPGIYRDSRGSAYHPHLRQEIPLGTIEVERYERPDYYFNKVLFIEKEGVISILKEAGWPERWDCALMSSKGYGSRAARDLIDKIAETSEPVQVFCAHDCDASGTMIYQTLCEATKARPERKIEIFNLGLDVVEAQGMGLQVEKLKDGNKPKPVADYVGSADEDWFSHYRIELNAMTTPQLIEWLDGKMTRYADQFKVVPPEPVVMKELEDEVKQRLRSKLEAEAWKAFGGERKLQATLKAALDSQDSSKTINSVTQFVHQIDRSAPWRDAVNYLAASIVS